MKVVGFFLMVLVLSSACVPMAEVAQAQEAPVIQYYILPADTSVPNYRGPMYLKWRFNPDGLDVNYWQIYYGQIDVMVVCVEAEQVEHDWLAVQAGIFQFPVNLETIPSPAELTTLETALEGAYIPADWLLPNMTWRESLRTVTGMMLFMGRLTTILNGQTPVDLGWTMNTQYSNLSAESQAAIVQAFESLGYDSSVIKTNWTLRILLKNAADQWGERPINFGGIDIL